MNPIYSYHRIYRPKNNSPSINSSYEQDSKIQSVTQSKESKKRNPIKHYVKRKQIPTSSNSNTVLNPKKSIEELKMKAEEGSGKHQASREERFELARTVFLRNPSEFNINNLGINGDEIQEFAMTLITLDDFPKYVHLFDISDEELLKKLALLSSPKLVAQYIQNFNIKDFNILNEIASKIVEFEQISCDTNHLLNFNFPQPILADILKKEAMAHHTSVHIGIIKKHQINDPQVLFDLAFFNAIQKGFETYKTLSQYQLSEEEQKDIINVILINEIESSLKIKFKDQSVQKLIDASKNNANILTDESELVQKMTHDPSLAYNLKNWIHAQKHRFGFLTHLYQSKDIYNHEEFTHLEKLIKILFLHKEPHERDQIALSIFIFFRDSSKLKQWFAITKDLPDYLLISTTLVFMTTNAEFSSQWIKNLNSWLKSLNKKDRDKFINDKLKHREISSFLFMIFKSPHNTPIKENLLKQIWYPREKVMTRIRALNVIHNLDPETAKSLDEPIPLLELNNRFKEVFLKALNINNEDLLGIDFPNAYQNNILVPLHNRDPNALMVYLSRMMEYLPFDKIKMIDAYTNFIIDLLKGVNVQNRYQNSQQIQRFINGSIQHRQIAEQWQKNQSERFNEFCERMPLSREYERELKNNPQKFDHFKIGISDDPFTMLLLGRETGGCLSLDKRWDKSKCLLGYIQEGAIKVITVSDEDNVSKGRSIIRLMEKEDDKSPALFLEVSYGSFDKQIFHYAREYAAKLKIPLYIVKKSEDNKTFFPLIDPNLLASNPTKLISHGLNAPYQYCDANNDISSGDLNIPHAYEVYPLFEPNSLENTN